MREPMLKVMDVVDAIADDLRRKHKRAIGVAIGEDQENKDKMHFIITMHRDGVRTVKAHLTFEEGSNEVWP